jgi:integrase
LGKRRRKAVRPVVSSLHQRPPNFLTETRAEDDLLVREWLLVLRGDGRSPRTLEGYAASVRQLSAFLARGGFPTMSAATAEHLREWLNALRERGNKPATVNTRYRAASAFYQWLVKEGEVRENPVGRIEPPRVPETVQAYYEAREVEAVLRSLRGKRLRGADGARMKAIVVVLFDTGLRASELCSLRTDDVNWDNQTIVVRGGKGGASRGLACADGLAFARDGAPLCSGCRSGARHDATQKVQPRRSARALASASARSGSFGAGPPGRSPMLRACEGKTIGLKGTCPMIVVWAPAADTDSAVVTATFIRCPVV